MPDLRPSPPSDDSGPLSGSPTVASARPPGDPSKLPQRVAALGLLGVAGFALMRLTMPAREVASECLRAALADKGVEVGDLSVEAEVVSTGKLEVAGRRVEEVARGPLSDRVRLEAVEHCRSVYVQRMGRAAAAPLIQIERGTASVRVERKLERQGAGTQEPQQPVLGAEVSVENLPGQGSCVTESSGQCELVLRDVGHDAKLSVAATLSNGAVVSRTTSALALLQKGLRLEALERAPAVTLSVLSCADRAPLAGVMVRASAVGAELWSTECGAARPEQPDQCREMMGRHGDVSFHYDTRPEQLTVTIIPPGEGGRETRDVTLGGLNVVELLYGPCPEAASPPAVDCQATRRSLESAAQVTRVPAGAAGHRLDVLVEVMSSGIVADIAPAAGSDPKALSALRLQLAGLRGLPGPCRDMPVTLHY